MIALILSGSYMVFHNIVVDGPVDEFMEILPLLVNLSGNFIAKMNRLDILHSSIVLVECYMVRL